jgi:deoxycytidylate deaminase
MSCAKKRVQCVLIAKDGDVFVGENWCNSPQVSCPREPGEGYQKCKDVCDQNAHAEVEAIQLAGMKARGATAYLINHHHYCRDCQVALFDAGVESLKRVEKMGQIPHPFRIPNDNLDYYYCA